ncbi:Thiol-disulfide isomerase or thioredoxin [Chitinophaga costaii]|uniref:Thiol-disulfide isomerase or thioredoxin n=1 Tax=Chitinophaga costaii TaxID=1335309 RepID=A0A1C4EVL5_9BACT|nr:TlpA disulfide reductase family protein [Chitinophaga costaii]PUZ21623.1 TlpA family protein disulfide reductase [Chitinophaga costaii]SCC47583.1 Thiol-disulfide isomerase or thioredoxin [Chitinophaga costaii]
MKKCINNKIFIVLISICAIVNVSGRAQSKKEMIIKLNINSDDHSNRDYYVYFTSIAYNDNIRNNEFNKVKLKKNKRGNYTARLISMRQPGYVSIVDKSPENNLAVVLPMSFIELGDSIEIMSKNTKYDSLIFAGKGAGKFTAKYQSDVEGSKDTTSNSMVKLSHYLSLLNNYKHQMSPYEYEVLKTDAISDYGEQMEKFNTEILEAIDRNEPVAKDYLYNTTSLENAMSTNTLTISKNFPNYKLLKLRNDYKFRYKTVSDTALYWHSIKLIKNTAIREKIITSLFVNWSFKMPNESIILEDALKELKNINYVNRLKAFNARNVGSYAYDFNLPDKNGKFVDAASFKGKVLFIDFWYTGCTNCASFYANEVSKIEEHYKNDSSIVFVTVSIDKSRDKWLRSLKSMLYTSASAINLYTDGQASDHEIIKHYQITAYPQPILIDKTGKIYNFNSSLLRHYNTAIQLIDNLIKQ